MLSQDTREFFYFKVPVFITDFAAHICVVVGLMYLLPDAQTLDLRNLDLTSVLVTLLVSYIAALSIVPIHLHYRKMKMYNVIGRAVKQNFLTYIFFTLLLAALFKITPRYVIVFSFILTLGALVVSHALAYKLIGFARTQGSNSRKVLIVGLNEISKRVYAELLTDRSFTGYNVAGFFTSTSDNAALPEGAQALGDISGIIPWLSENTVDEIYSSLDPADYPAEVASIVKYANDNFVHFYFVPTFDGYPKRHMQIERLGDVNIMKLRHEPLNSAYAQILKRGFDILVSGLFLCTLYPFVVLFVSLGNVVFGNRGPLYFRQTRTGYNGESFRIYKFRSMRPSDDADTKQATNNDPRKTKFGDFLRRSSIDELPQFINVFLGDMSVIGPRPHMEYHTQQYSGLIEGYMVRHLAKPGITGWAQISGCRGETKTVEEMKARVEHDIWYIEHWSPMLDVFIFVKTIWQVTFGHDKQAY